MNSLNCSKLDAGIRAVKYYVFYEHFDSQNYLCHSRWLRSLRRRSTAARLLRLWVRIPSGACLSVYCECCVLSGRGLCDELITSPEGSYRLWCVVVCDLETCRMRRPWPTWGGRAESPKTNYVLDLIMHNDEPNFAIGTSALLNRIRELCSVTWARKLGTLAAL